MGNPSYLCGVYCGSLFGSRKTAGISRLANGLCSSDYKRAFPNSVACTVDSIRLLFIQCLRSVCRCCSHRKFRCTWQRSYRRFQLRPVAFRGTSNRYRYPTRSLGAFLGGFLLQFVCASLSTFAFSPSMDNAIRSVAAKYIERNLRCYARNRGTLFRLGSVSFYREKDPRGSGVVQGRDAREEVMNQIMQGNC